MNELSLDNAEDLMSRVAGLHRVTHEGRPAAVVWP